jgi:hypothetical protein
MDVFKVTIEDTEEFLVGAGSLAEVVEAYSDYDILEIRNLGTLVPMPPKVSVDRPGPGMEDKSVSDMIKELEADLANACCCNRSHRHA